MRENYDRGLYEGKEYQCWQKVSTLKEKFDLLSRLPKPANERAGRTLLDLHESWEWATMEGLVPDWDLLPAEASVPVLAWTTKVILSEVKRSIDDRRSLPEEDFPFRTFLD